MTTPDNGSGVIYTAAEPSYFEKRVLRKHARVFHLWALGVGAVISGDFSGWNLGLSVGGFGGLLVATVVITVMYFGLCFSTAEMSPALPHAGGAYSFARSAMGPWGGYVTGLAENMEYIFTPAVIVYFVGTYMAGIFNTPASWAPLWWFLTYGLFVALNVWGVALSFRVSIFITLLALLILVVFFIGAVPKYSLERFALDVPVVGSGTRWLPLGWKGVVGCFPFAIWFYLAIEELPLAAEESHNPRADMPKGILAGLVTLTLAAFLTLILNSGIAPGAKTLASSGAPLLDGFKTIFGDGVGARALALIAVAGLVASVHTIIFAFGRQIFSLSRAGYFPKFLSLTHPTRHTPYLALVSGAALGLAVLLGGALPAAWPAGGGHRRDAAEHGGVRGGDLLRTADELVYPAALATAPYRAPLSQSTGCARGGGCHGHRGSDFGHAVLFRSELSQGGPCRRCVVCGGFALFCAAWTQATGQGAGGRVRPARVGAGERGALVEALKNVVLVSAVVFYPRIRGSGFQWRGRARWS